MFAAGDKIVYGANGVCVVAGTCTSPFGGGDLRVYYMLHPIDDENSVIYTPAQFGKAVLRPLMTREEAEKVLKDAHECEELHVHTEKQRRDVYRAALLSADPREYIRIIRTVEHRREIALRTHRHIAITDTEFERNARYFLLSELSLVLGKTYGELENELKAALGIADRT